MPSSLVALDNPKTRLIAIGLMCCAITCFSVLDAAAKYLMTVAALPVFQVVWLRFLSHAVFTLAVFGPRNFIGSLRSARPALQMFRGALLFLTTICNFAALRYLQLDQIATLFFLSPFIVALLAGPYLGEWIGWRRLMAIMVGFSGVILIMRPGFGGIHWAVFYSFGATFCYACYTVLTRYLARHDPSLVTQVYSPLAGVVLLAPLALWSWDWPAETSTLLPVIRWAWEWPADIWIWLLLLSTGISGGFGHYLLILAHRRAPAPILAPFTYVGLISQSIIGYLVFSDIPSLWTLAGGAVIIGSGLYLLYRERTAMRAENATVSAPAATAGR